MNWIRILPYLAIVGLFVVPVMVNGDATVEVGLMEYEYTSTKNCDNFFGGYKCDPYFKVCIVTPSQGCWSNKVTTSNITDKNKLTDIMHTIEIHPNPIQFHFTAIPTNITIRVEVWNDNPFSDRHLDTAVWMYRGYHNMSKNVTVAGTQGHARVKFYVKIQCDKNFYGPACSIGCVHTAHGRCDISGTLICDKGYTGQTCYTREMSSKQQSTASKTSTNTPTAKSIPIETSTPNTTTLAETSEPTTTSPLSTTSFMKSTQTSTSTTTPMIGEPSTTTSMTFSTTTQPKTSMTAQTSTTSQESISTTAASSTLPRETPTTTQMTTSKTTQQTIQIMPTPLTPTKMVPTDNVTKTPLTPSISQLITAMNDFSDKLNTLASMKCFDNCMKQVVTESCVQSKFDELKDEITKDIKHELKTEMDKVQEHLIQINAKLAAEHTELTTNP